MGFLGTTAGTLSDLSLVLLVVAAGLITHAWRLAARGEGARHRVYMLAGVGAAWFFFLSYMLNRILRVGDIHFPGPEALYSAWWIPLIAVHSLAATLVLGWSVVQVWGGFRHARRAGAALVLPADRRPRHAKGGRAFLALWYVTTATGVLVYLSLYVIWA